MDKARMDIPATARADASDLKAAAIARNQAFIVIDIVKRKRKKMLQCESVRVP